MFEQNIFFGYDIWRFWFEIMKPISHQTWDDDTNRVVKNGSPYYKVRLFPSRNNDKQDAVVYLFPPHAGRHPNVVNAMILAMQNAGYDVIVFEILPAQWGINSINLEDLIEMGLEAYSYDKRKKIVGGVCQGMWQSVITTALADRPPIAQFGVAGPIDFWAGDGYIKNACQYLPIGYTRAVVNMCGGIQPGWLQWINFFNMNPWAIMFDEPMKLLKHIMAGDEKKIAKWREIWSWYCDHQSLWGDAFVDIVEKLFKGNQLIRKELKIFGQIVDLKKIIWPFFIYAGDKDVITPPPQSFGLAEYIGSDVVAMRLLENCGHTAAFNAPHALKQIITDLKNISGRSAKKERRLNWMPPAVTPVKE
jgi:poly(3-hydroxyalkanoate) synthetase